MKYYFLFLAVMNLITLLLYKRLSVPIKKLIQEQGGSANEVQHG